MSVQPPEQPPGKSTRQPHAPAPEQTPFSVTKKTFFGYSLKDLFFSASPSVLIGLTIIAVTLHYITPAPPQKIVIATGDGEGDYSTFAKMYRDILKNDGVELEVRNTKGAVENLEKLNDPTSGVQVAFVQDGVGSAETSPDVSSLGSLYYEPIWIFYPSTIPVTHRLNDLAGKRIAIGISGSGTQFLVQRLLRAAGVDVKTAKFLKMGNVDAATALHDHTVDFGFFMAPIDDPLVSKLARDSSMQLLNLDQAEAISRQNPYLHHLVLPHGTIDLKRGIPATDVDMVAPTATLLVRDDIHPSMSYLLLHAVAQVHDDPGVFEKRKEFPTDNNYEFPLSDEAARYYKTGLPFWQKYLPYWAASILDRFLVLILPLLALLYPIVKAIPNIYRWRIRTRIYQHYGELKFLETQLNPLSGEESLHQFYSKLDDIEDRVNQMKVPLEFSEHIYSLRGHIDLVRARLLRLSQHL